MATCLPSKKKMASKNVDFLSTYRVENPGKGPMKRKFFYSEDL